MPEQDRDNQLLTSWLADRDQPCPRCAYNLRGLKPTGDTPRCPECDLPIELRLTEAEGSVGPWLLAYTSFALGLGFDGVVLLMLTTMTIRSRGAGADLSLVVLFLMLFLLAAGSLAGVMRLKGRRARWANQAARDRWIRAWSLFGGVFLVHLLSAGAFVLWAFVW